MSCSIIDQKSVYLHKTQDVPYPQLTPGSTMGYQADFAVSLQVYSEQWPHKPEKQGDFLNTQMTQFQNRSGYKWASCPSKARTADKQQICECQQMFQDRFQAFPLEK